MSILTFPTFSDGQVPVSVLFQLITNTQVHQSPLNNATQTIELPGAYWYASLSYQALTKPNARIMKAFLAQLRGAAGRFYLWNHSHKTPAGVATGTPVVNGANQTGNTLNTSGWTAGVTGILKAGDFVQVGTELKIIVADCNSDGSGLATLTFEPPLRSSPDTASPIVVSSPKCIMRLKDDEQDSLAFGVNNSVSFTMEAVEVFA